MVDGLAEFERHIRETPAPPLRLGDVPAEHLRLARHAARCGDSETLVGQFLSTRGYRPLGSEPAILRALVQADPWWISPDLCEIADVARESMQPHHLHVEDVPAAHGLVFFGRPLSGLIDGAAFDSTISALGWNGWTEGVLVHAWHLTTANVLDLNSGTGTRAWLQLGSVLWPWGTRSDDDASDSTMEDFHRLSCIWALASEKRISTQTPTPVQPRDRRRAARSGWPIRNVVAVDLRRPAASAGSTGHSHVEYSHRWIVRGYWRQQPVGPGGTERRPTYVAPHAKGPGDKPLIVKSHVSVVR